MSRSASRTFSGIYYGPPDYLSQKFSARDRRAFAFWSLVLAACGALMFGGYVWYVTALSVLALVANFTAETPVEEENESASLPEPSPRP